MDSLDETCSLTGYEADAYDFKWTYLESCTELLTSPPFSKQGFPEDAEYDDAALEEMLHNAHRVHVHNSQREDLSVGQSSSVSERTERGDLLSQVVRMHRLELRWTGSKSKFSPDVKRK